MAGTRVRRRRRRQDSDSDAVNDHVGRRLRDRRRALGLSQAELAQRLGFTPAQINRYEHGTTRLSAAGLWRAARNLGVAPGFFYEGLDTPMPPAQDPEVEAQALRIARLLQPLNPTIQDKLVAFIASLTRR